MDDDMPIADAQMNEAGSDAPVADDGDGIVADGGEQDDDQDIYFTREIGGLSFVLERFHGRQDSRKDYERMSIACPCADHAKCGKRRAFGESQCIPLGKWQPFAYLAAWAQHGSRAVSRQAHMTYAPSLAEQRAWLEANGLR